MAMKLFIAGPYIHNDFQSIILNIDKARSAAVALWDMGHQCFTPHLNTANFDRLTKAPEHLFKSFDLHVLRCMDGIVLLKAWKDSAGARDEYEEAIRLRKRIFFWPDDQERLKEES